MENTREMLQGLIDDFRRQEREQLLLAAANTWVNAFSSFKRMRNRIGLPNNTGQQRLFYGALLGSLKGSGKNLIAWFEKTDCVPSSIGITMEDLKACVDELVVDDRILDQNLHDADFSDLEARFCKP